MAIIKVILFCCLAVAYVNSSARDSKRVVELERQLLEELDVKAKREQEDKLYREITQEMNKRLDGDFASQHGGKSCDTYYSSVKNYECDGQMAINYANCNGDVTMNGADMSTCLSGYGDPSIMDVKLTKNTPMTITPHAGALKLEEFCIQAMMVYDATVTATTPDGDVTKKITFLLCETPFYLGCTNFDGVKVSSLSIKFRHSAPSHYAKGIFGQGCTP